MGREDVLGLFEEKYHKLLGQSYEDWAQNAPQTEDEAYRRCIAIDKELNTTYDQWFEAQGERKEQLQEYRGKLKAEYDLIEEIFHLDFDDRSW